MTTKEKIFDVSIDLFSKYGYDRVSIRQIASEVGIKERVCSCGYKYEEIIPEKEGLEINFGCSGSVLTSLFGLSVLSVMTLIMKKKKEDW